MTAITKTIRKAMADQTYTGATLEAMTHGVVDLRVDTSRAVYVKRVGMHERLYARGKITDAEWNWASRYVRETEIAAGARPGRPEFESAQAWSGPLIYNRQCAAAGFLRRAHERITGQERLVLIAACVECATIADIAPLLGLVRRPDEPGDRYEDRVSVRVTAACVRIIRQASGAKKA